MKGGGNVMFRYIKIITDIEDPDALGGVYRAVGGILELDCILADVIPKVFYHYEARKNIEGKTEYSIIVPKEYFSVVNDLMCNILVTEIKMDYITNLKEVKWDERRKRVR